MKKIGYIWIIFFVLVISGCAAKPADLPEDTTQAKLGAAETFFSYLKAGEFQAAMDCLAEPVDLGEFGGIENIPEEAKSFFSKLEYEIKGIGPDGKVMAAVTCIDVEKEVPAFVAEYKDIILKREVPAIKQAYLKKVAQTDLKMKKSNLNIQVNEDGKIIFSKELEKALFGDLLQLIRKFGV